MNNLQKNFLSFAILLSFFNALYGVSMANIANMFNFSEQGVLPGSQHLLKTNRFGRPLYIVLLHAALIFLLITFIPNADAWSKLTGLGVMTAFTLTQIAVAIYDFKNACYGSLFVTLLGFSSLTVAGFFTIKSLDPDNIYRLIYASPILIGLLVGYIMFKLSKKQNG